MLLAIFQFKAVIFIGLAHLKDGTSIDYNVYIATHPHWQKVRQARFKFDDGKCVVCHCDLNGLKFETHHLSYMHLGDERLTEVITLCPQHHTIFHNNWRKQDYWKGREIGHWEAFDLENTAKLCSEYYKKDKFISRNVDGLNLCNKDVIRQVVDEFIENCGFDRPPIIDTNDVLLFVRNKRWEQVFEAADRGLSIEQFLDEAFGPKIRGKNKLRAEANAASSYKHELKSMRRHYRENRNLILLMQEAKKYE